MGIAALVLGIVGLVGSFIPCAGMYALPLTLLGVILGALAMRAPKDGSPPKGKGMAIAGLVCGVIGTLIAAYWLYVYIKFKDEVNSGRFQKGLNDAIKEEMRKNGDKAGDDFTKAIQDGLDKAKAAKETAGEAKDMADEAKAKADEAEKKADEAKGSD